MESKPTISYLTQAIKSNPGLFYFLKAGDLVEGKLLAKSPRELIVDLGKYGTGIIYRAEMQNAKAMVKNLQVGDSITAKVVTVDNEDNLRSEERR